MNNDARRLDENTQVHHLLAEARDSHGDIAHSRE